MGVRQDAGLPQCERERRITALFNAVRSKSFLCLRFARSAAENFLKCLLTKAQNLFFLKAHQSDSLLAQAYMRDLPLLLGVERMVEEHKRKLCALNYILCSG